MQVVLLSIVTALVYHVPDGWVSKETSSRMRLAQWELPDEDSAEIVIFYFGPGGGGSVDANLERWFGQFQQPDGSSTRERAEIETRKVDGLTLTTADIRGTYVAPVRPGATQRHHRPDHRMLATVVEGEGGPWFIRALGPEATLAEWEASIEQFLLSLRLE